MNAVELHTAQWCEYEHVLCFSDDCVLGSAENRLREAHKHWHACANEYDVPEDFRVSLNAMIQSLRNITFALQKQKSNLPGFDNWYAKKQGEMRNNSAMKWALKARNRIVKEDDLQTSSTLVARLATSYDSESELVRSSDVDWMTLSSFEIDESTSSVRPPVDLTAREVLEHFSSIDMPMAVRQNASVLLERTWVDNEVPQVELLSLLAHVYGNLRQLIVDAHELLGMRLTQIPVIRHEAEAVPAARPVSRLPLEGRLRCMVGTHQYRTKRLRLLDGSEVSEWVNIRVDPDPKIAQMVVDSGIYGEHPEPPPGGFGDLQESADLAKLVHHYANLAAGILGSGQDHGWFSYYFRNGTLHHAQFHSALDAHGKRAIAGDIVRVARQTEADAVVMIGEAWVSPMTNTPDGTYVQPSLHPDRQEVVMINAISKGGAAAGGVIPFVTIAGEPPKRVVRIGDFSADSQVGGLMKPLMEAWGLINPLRGAAFWRAQRSNGPSGPSRS